MSLLRALFRRSSLENPRTPLSAPAEWLYGALGVVNTYAGVDLSEKGALKCGTVFQCADILGDMCGALPLKCYEKQGRASRLAEEIPEYALLKSAPNPKMTAQTFRKLLTVHTALWGNGYARIERWGGGRVRYLWPLQPWETWPANAAGELGYETRIDGKREVLRSDEVLHLLRFSLDGVTGESVVGYARQAVAMGLAAEKFGAKFYANSARPSGVLETPGIVTPEQEKNLRESFRTATGGDNAHGVAMMSGGMKWTPLTMPLKDAEFIETRRFQAEEIARWFRIPGVLLGLGEKNSTYASAEQFFLSLEKHTLWPWLSAWEQEIDRKLLSGPDYRGRNFYSKFNLDGLRRAEFKARQEGLQVMRQNGIITSNEWREIEERNPLPEDQHGDEVIIPANMTPASKIGSPDSGDAPDAPPPAMEPMRHVFADAIQRILRWERRDETRAAAALEPVLRSMAEVAGRTYRPEWAREILLGIAPEKPTPEIIEAAWQAALAAVKG